MDRLVADVGDGQALDDGVVGAVDHHALLPAGDLEAEKVPVRGPVEVEGVSPIGLAAVEERVLVNAQRDGLLMGARRLVDVLYLVVAWLTVVVIAGNSSSARARQGAGH